MLLPSSLEPVILGLTEWEPPASGLAGVGLIGALLSSSIGSADAVAGAVDDMNSRSWPPRLALERGAVGWLWLCPRAEDRVRRPERVLRDAGPGRRSRGGFLARLASSSWPCRRTVLLGKDIDASSVSVTTSRGTAASAAVQQTSEAGPFSHQAREPCRGPGQALATGGLPS